MDAGNGNRYQRQYGKPDTDDNEEKGDDRQPFALREAGKKGLNRVEYSWRQARQKNGKKGEAKGSTQDHAGRLRLGHQQSVNGVSHRGCEFSAWDCGTRREK